MFDLGFLEIAFILVAVIIFIKPQDIPSFLKKVGNIWSQIRGFIAGAKYEMQSVLDPVDDIVTFHDAPGSMPESQKKQTAQEEPNTKPVKNRVKNHARNKDDQAHQGRGRAS